MSSVEHPEGASLLPTRQINEASNAVQKSRPDFLLWCCRVFNLITGICALLCAVALSIAIGLQAGSVRKGVYEFSGQALRVFGVLIAGVLVLAETEWRRVLQFFPLLDSWLGRGVTQVFEAMLTYREAVSAGGTDIHKSLQLYRSVACLSLLLCASIYILGALLCIGAVRKARYKREETLLKAQAELEALEKRRGALQRVLNR